jgi:uncharacterized protein (DUF1800 family)
MTLSRRDFLRLASLAAAGLAASACSPAYSRLAGGSQTLAGWPPTDAQMFRALGRLTFGPRAEERLRALEIGLPAWIEEQLAPGAIDDAPAEWRLRQFDTLKLKANELFEYGNKLFEDLDRTLVVDELRQATLVRQVYSRRQLYEVMVEFWTDHFNVSVEKGDCWYLKTVDDREVIRKHALGSFRDLLWASAHSPAMLVYLDNQANVAGTPNENYAREVMELHTLGVDGGYSQQDVMELARCLTGWSVKEHLWKGDFTFNADQHDAGVKTVLGLSLHPDGVAEAERVLDLLAVHPSTARFIATKLARRFIADDPPPALVDAAAATFLQTDGDIQAVLRSRLLDGLSQAGPKYKRPQAFVISALRLLNAETGNGGRQTRPTYPLHDYLARLGQLPFGWPTPDGYPDEAARWTGNLIPRWQFALALARNDIDGTSIDLPGLLESAQAGDPTRAADQLGVLLIGAPLDPGQRDSLLASLAAEGADEQSLPQIITAGLVASPAFQWR